MAAGSLELSELFKIICIILEREKLKCVFK